MRRRLDGFTREIGAWWDPDKHLLVEPLAEMDFEPRVGGHIIDRGMRRSRPRAIGERSSSRSTATSTATATVGSHA